METPTLPNFKPSDIARVFKGAPWLKGEMYFCEGYVIDVQVDAEGVIRGFVRDLGGGPYRQRIVSRFEGTAWKFEGTCTCPAGANCVHVVAVLLRYAAHPPKPPAVPKPYEEYRPRAKKAAKPAGVPRNVPESPAKPPGQPTPEQPKPPPPETPQAPPTERPTPAPSEQSSNPTPEQPSTPPPEAPTSPKAAALADLPVDPVVTKWLTNLAGALNPTAPAADNDHPRLFYLLSSGTFVHKNDACVRVVSGRENRGQFTVSAALRTDEMRRVPGSAFERPGDDDAIHVLERYGTGTEYMRASYRVSGRDGAHVLSVLAKTGRLLWAEGGMTKLAAGDPRPLRATWRVTKAGNQALQLSANCHLVLQLTPPWYVDLETKECGPLEPGMPLPVYTALLTTPEIPPEHSELVHRQLAQLIPDRPDLLPEIRGEAEVRVIPPQPRLTVSRKMWTEEPYRHYRKNLATVIAPVGKLEFYYEGVRAKASDVVIRANVGEKALVMPRQEACETAAWQVLFKLGWRPASEVIGWQAPKGFGTHLALVPDGELREPVLLQMLFEFIDNIVPTLRVEGWDVRVEGDPQMVRENDYEWQLDANAEGTEWFNLELGILVDGRRVPLRPMLAGALELAQRKTKSGSVEDLRDDHKVFHQLPNGKVLVLPMARLKPLFRTLVELFGPMSGWTDVMRLPTLRASEIAELDQAAQLAGLALRAPERLMRLSGRLANFDRIASVVVPPSFQGELRHYQESGLAWLQFLRELEFGGILADDMGLGKTVQTLAHICVEKAAGRLEQPALIVGPTSTLPNWRHEAQRFAPSLKVLTLHGSQRSKEFASLGDYDVILTSFPLLARDKDILHGREFHLVVLDEAQNIKNPTTAMAKAACGLKSKHRLCLTGTPVENNLEELWSIFHFLSPGLFGTVTDFRRDFRAPIEKQADEEARRRLSRRTRPFILRRTKELVATELPPKTEVVERVELDGPQRDLYEGVRLAMDERVRDLLATKGFNRSRIEVLEALLKLRQVCCDPRLVKLPSAAEVKSSAKLERLLEMLEELREQGRTVLLFSQFTSMLDLIEPELRRRNWDWVRISGETQDRDTPVKRFQSGEVRLFLISLKAGGTGLNLTAADTVIHYDPWWNPAVERQATDRAHRIGQDKAVFVYKLVAEGTVEEKILELQERKGKLAAAVLDGEADLAAALTADDLKWVLEG